MKRSLEFSETIPSLRRDFVEWHRGRAPYVFWALDVDQALVRRRVSEAAATLSGLLLDDYRRQPHVTLDVCGFPATGQLAVDEFDAALLARQQTRLVAAGCAPFEIEVGGLHSFAAAPYLTVHDPQGGIAALRACLASEQGNRLWGDFVPHLTVGLYRAAWPASRLAEHLAVVGSEPVTPVRIDRICLMAYAPSAIAGPLQTLAEYRFGEVALRWLANGPEGMAGG